MHLGDILGGLRLGVSLGNIFGGLGLGGVGHVFCCLGLGVGHVFSCLRLGVSLCNCLCHIRSALIHSFILNVGGFRLGNLSGLHCRWLTVVVVIDLFIFGEVGSSPVFVQDVGAYCCGITLSESSVRSYWV